MLKMFMRSDVAERIVRLHRSIAAPTAKQIEDFKASRAARTRFASRVTGARPSASSEPENYAVVGSVAQICVEGVLSEEPDFWAWLFGLDGTTYEDIRDAFALAAADPLVKSVILSVCSPGGYCDGLFETLAAVESFGKPIAVQASEACSAAYALAAMGGPITPMGPASQFGSIGVACDFSFYSDIENVSITSTEAPDKRPDPRTPEGKKVIVAYLDDYHELFVDAIARGRSNATGKTFTVEQVNAEFGRGAVYLADDAKAAGMIDKLPRAVKRGSSATAEDPEPSESAPAPPALAAVIPITKSPSAPSVEAAAPSSQPRASGPTEKKKMDLATLKKDHPELYAQIAAEGQASERKRVLAHLKLGKSSGAMNVAEKAIADGSSTMDEDVFAEYQTAAMNRSAVGAHAADSAAAGTVVAGATPPAAEGAKDLGDQVAERAAAARGKKLAS